MKCIKVLMVAVAIFTSSVSLSAQWTGGLVRGGYSPYTLKDDDSSINAPGLMAGFSMGNRVSSSVPLYADYGLDIHYAWKDEKVKYNFLSAVIPVNIAYKFDVNDSPLSFYPYAGFAAGLNILANAKYQGETVNLFDSYGEGDDHWKRVQLGVQVGIKIIINDRFTVGYEYRPFISEAAEGLKTSYNTFFIGVPLSF